MVWKWKLNWWSKQQVQERGWLSFINNMSKWPSFLLWIIFTVIMIYMPHSPLLSLRSVLWKDVRLDGWQSLIVCWSFGLDRRNDLAPICVLNSALMTLLLWLNAQVKIFRGLTDIHYETDHDFLYSLPKS